MGSAIDDGELKINNPIDTSRSGFTYRTKYPTKVLYLNNVPASVTQCRKKTLQQGTQQLYSEQASAKLQFGFDSVTIFDGYDNSSSSVKITGYPSLGHFRSSGRYLYIELKSDEATQRSGFLAKYTPTLFHLVKSSYSLTDCRRRNLSHRACCVRTLAIAIRLLYYQLPGYFRCSNDFEAEESFEALYLTVNTACLFVRQQKSN
ncbi:hypothetical protein CLF_109022 [Clonorchis sinensis]|uniref:CUB domain-containing protein n=1 Tax=Clonorchis sinensis TaxID=79923 RepID=G7YS69_CLOSI|nr:hypothetical protein CLF_109022 [Clonorchis sinensis]